MKGDPFKRDTSKYYAFHGKHGHYTNNCNAWKRHLEELVRKGHCTEFVAKRAMQQIEDRDAAAKEPPQKVIRINIILADFQGSGLTTKERKRKDRSGNLCLPSHNGSTSHCGYTRHRLPEEGLDRA
ncbi:unnamed protein product [Prunus armeniaca]